MTKKHHLRKVLPESDVFGADVSLLCPPTGGRIAAPNSLLGPFLPECREVSHYPLGGGGGTEARLRPNSLVGDHYIVARERTRLGVEQRWSRLVYPCLFLADDKMDCIGTTRTAGLTMGSQLFSKI